jgi:hypothetical protein
MTTFTITPTVNQAKEFYDVLVKGDATTPIQKCP